MGAAYFLSRQHDVTLYEAESRLGGHARTIMAGPNKDVPVDTGFMVFNNKTYPNLTALFDEFDVPVKPTNMSFAASFDHGQFEYGLHNFTRLFCDPTNAIRPKFWQMIGDILKFNREAITYADDNTLSIGGLIEKLKLSDAFTRYYLCPFAGAIWSTARKDMMDFPAQSLLRFFDNHALLSASENPEWLTIDGGSREYVSRLERALKKNGAEILAPARVQSVRRDERIYIQAMGAPPRSFDYVVFASHADQTLKLLEKPTSDETKILGDLRYRPNRAYLHADTSHMPKRRAAWSSWVYRGQDEPNSPNGSFTYWMNLLQSIPNSTPLFVTLNPVTPIDEALIYDETEFYHPQFDMNALRAQSQLPSIQGQHNTWFCGAYARYGFHEDGLHSAINVVNAINSQPAFA